MMLFNGINDAIKCIEDFGSVIVKVKWKATTIEGTRLKILIPKQMVQRLPIALAQLKAGNNS